MEQWECSASAAPLCLPQPFVLVSKAGSADLQDQMSLHFQRRSSSAWITAQSLWILSLDWAPKLCLCHTAAIKRRFFGP